MPLTESYVPADTSSPVLETTVGGILRDAAARAPDRVALIEGVPGARRSWTFAELLADAERVARALAARFAKGDRGRGLGAEHPGVGAARVRRRSGRGRARDRQPGLPGEGTRVRAAAVAVFGHLLPALVPRQPDGGVAQAGCGWPAGVARAHPLRRLRGVHSLGARRCRPARRESGRPGADPVHIGHNGLSQGGVPPSPRDHEQRPASSPRVWASSRGASTSTRCRCSTPAAACWASSDPSSRERPWSTWSSSTRD